MLYLFITLFTCLFAQPLAFYYILFSLSHTHSHATPFVFVLHFLSSSFFFQLCYPQLAEVRRARDEEATGRAKLQGETNRQQKELERLQFELEQVREAEARLKEEVSDLHEDLKEARVNASNSREEAQGAKSALEVEKKKNEDLLEEVEELRETADEASTRIHEAESRAKAAEDDLKLLQGKAAGETARYRDLVDDLTHKNAHIEEELRQEFSNQLSQILAERQQQFEEEKNDGLANLKAIYDEKISAYRDHLERAGHELEMLKAQKSAAQKEAHESRSISDEFETIKIQLQKRIVELEDDVKTERAKPNRDLAQKNDIIRRLKNAFKRKDEEFDELMDVKIALAMEIKAYRQLLESEEDRLGYESPTKKKRKRHANDDAATAESDEEEEDDLIISGMDLMGDYINIRNSSTRTIALDGYQLRSSEDHFDLPSDIVLKSGESVTVWTSEDAEEKEDPPTDLAWVATDSESVFDDKGDEVILVDPNGNPISRYEVIGSNPDMDEDSQTEGEEGDKNCIIM